MGSVRGYKRRLLLQDIASGQYKGSQLAEKYGISRGYVSDCKTKFAEEIEHIRTGEEDQYAGLWIAQKWARLAEYQQDIEDINEKLAEAKEEDEPIPAALVRLKHGALHNAAEELGALPVKAQIVETGKEVRYIIDGVDKGSLT